MKLSLLASVVALALVPVYLRTIYESNQALKEATYYQKQGDKIEEMFQAFTHAISWSSPGNYFARKAKRTLINSYITNDALSRSIRLQAARSYYQGLMKSRSFLSESAELTQAKLWLQEIAPEYVEPRYKKVNKTAPSYGVQLAAQSAFWLWIISVSYINWAGFRKDGSVVLVPFRRGLLLATSFFVLWCIFLNYA